MASVDGSRAVGPVASGESVVVAPLAGEIDRDRAPTPPPAPPVSLYLRHAALLI